MKTGYRNAWILFAIVVVFIVSFFFFTLDQNEPGHEPQWDMGGEAFVPASSPFANGYYLPVDREATATKGKTR